MNIDERLMLVMAADEARLSLDPSTKVGAVVAVPGGPQFQAHNRFLGEEHPELMTREQRYATVVHAELQALLLAGSYAQGATLYASEEPCRECAKAAIAAGVARIVFLSTTTERRERWDCNTGKSLAAFEEVDYVEVPREDVENPT